MVVCDILTLATLNCR
uniref:Uncharacterized protein n=1 Tax=Anguilla anguilla TaxID=7936 RepID=A0A0E9UF33_ANGAN